MQTLENIVSTIIWHNQFNLGQKDNLRELPSGSAVFGIFAMLDNDAVNCRYIGESADLRQAVSNLYEHPENEGLKKFMQGPWIKTIRYVVLPESSREDRERVMREWAGEYKPAIDDEGEYPGYYFS